MKYLLWILLLFVLAVVLTEASHSPAYLLLVYPPYRIELSFLLFILLLLLLFAIVYALLRLLSIAMRLPEKVRSFRLARAQARSHKLLQNAITAFLEGRYAAAERASSDAMAMDDSYELHSIIAARSAHELRQYDKRDTYLSAAAEKSHGEATMRLMAASKFMLDQHDPRGALDALQQLHKAGAKGRLGRLAMEMQAQQQLGNWDEVLKALEQLEQRAAIDATAASRLRQQAWLEKIRQQDSLSGLTACIDKIPAEFRRRNQVCGAAVRALMKYGDGSLAQQLLADSLNANWDGELVALYGDCVADDAVAQIEQAKKWLDSNRQDAGLLLALGKLHIRQQLWERAKSYLDASVSIRPTEAAWVALAEVAERLGDSAAASRYLRQAMGDDHGG
ncbi:MAG: heme biosynthesis HemY N-terminal domain-containing protein [Pseudomonadota bacterium]